MLGELRGGGFFEPALSAASAITVAQAAIPEANAAAWAGLPGVIV